MTGRQLISTRRDELVAAAVAAVYVLEIATESGFDGDRAVSIPAAIIFSATLAVRRYFPVLPLVAAIGVIELSNLAAPSLAETAGFLFGIVLTMYSCGAHARGRNLVASALLVAVAIPLAAIETGQSLAPADLGFFVMFFGGPWVAGRVIRHRRDREQTLEERTVDLERERDERAREAVAEERARIARELHDVVSHAVSVIVLQARGARRTLPSEAEAIRGSLDTIERSGRQALDEMRRLLNVLRQDADGASLAPQPSLRLLTELVDDVRAAGLPVELTVHGAIDDLPPGVDVSAYRIVQEALTNALKHAGPACARVDVRRSPHELEIEVADDGSGGTVPLEGSGRGLLGMRERVAIYGGRLEVGARADGGYALTARLPLGSPG